MKTIKTFISFVFGLVFFQEHSGQLWYSHRIRYLLMCPYIRRL